MILLGLARLSISAYTDMADDQLGIFLSSVMRSLALEFDEADVYVMTTYNCQ